MMPTAYATSPNISYPSQSSFDENAPLSDRVYNFVTTNGLFWLGVSAAIGAASLTCSYFFTPFAALGIIPSVICAIIGMRKLMAASDPANLFSSNPHQPSWEMSQYIQGLRNMQMLQNQQVHAHHHTTQYSNQIQEALNFPEAREKFEALIHLLANFPTLRGVLLTQIPQNERIAINDIFLHYNQADQHDKHFLVDALFGILRTSVSLLSPEAELNILHMLQRFIPSLSRDLGTPSVRGLREILTNPETTQKLATLLRLSSYFPMIRDLLLEQAAFTEADKQIVLHILQEYDNGSSKDKKAFEEIVQLILLYACYEVPEEQARNIVTTMESLSTNTMLNFIFLIL